MSGPGGAAWGQCTSSAVIPQNEEALKFWQSQGFTETRRGMNRDGYDVVVMGREI